MSNKKAAAFLLKELCLKAKKRPYAEDTAGQTYIPFCQTPPEINPMKSGVTSQS
jgi:hypothetical protein